MMLVVKAKIIIELFILAMFMTMLKIIIIPLVMPVMQL